MDKQFLKILMGTLSVIVFFISTFFSWYEGSDLVVRESRWDTTAILSNWIGEVNTKGDIYQLDYLIYAAKYKPLFPSIMIISLSILFLLTADKFLKSRQGLVVLILSGALFFLAGLILGFTIEENTVISILFLIVGIIFLGNGAIKVRNSYRINPPHQ
ncbi:YjdJ family protein [Bacillus tianshenii]|uniref:DUF4306 domain-containing protein n=1 Tax=Sutcliffiella tianshenii TaxID=1463404 RepID=UPI001CD249DF|nr:DUF4306 domain-containing protein [Bacillus tianshenii]MCA1322350.1 YjdJ family protein [Bacillus tianshenii]